MKLRDSKQSVYIRYPKFYAVWNTMRYRCDNPKCNVYSYYGGRGIKYDERWSEVENFYTDMFERYEEGLMLDRIDNSGPYTKENCRWVNRIAQANNRRNNNCITYQGETHTIAEWARRLGLNHNTLWHRIMVYKWPLDRCMTSQSYRFNQTRRCT